METLGIHHLGVAVVDLDEAIETYRRLFGAELEHRDVVPDQGVEAASLRAGGSRVELLAPTAADSPVGKFLGEARARHAPRRLRGRATSVPHSRELDGAGAELIDAEPRRGLFGLQVAFVHPDSVHGVLTEVVSRV